MVLEVRKDGIAVEVDRSVPVIARRALDAALGAVVTALFPGSDERFLRLCPWSAHPVIRGVGKRQIEISREGEEPVRFYFDSLSTARTAIASFRSAGHPVDAPHLVLTQ